MMMIHSQRVRTFITAFWHPGPLKLQRSKNILKHLRCHKGHGCQKSHAKKGKQNFLSIGPWMPRGHACQGSHSVSSCLIKNYYLM